MDKKTNEQTERLRKQLHAHINSFKVEIDRNVFRKTFREKEALKLAKAEHKLYLSRQQKAA